MESLSAVGLETASSSHIKVPKVNLSMLQMLLLNAVVCGVEIVACAGFTYVPPMLLKAGYSEENMGFLLGMGPLMGFLFVPIIGRSSDRCYSRFGRRRPFILGLAVLLVCAMYLIPFGEYFASLFFGSRPISKTLGSLALAVGVVLLDFTTQASLTPCEALLNDASKNSEQNEKIFTVYSLMISSGGIIGYLLTAIDWTTNPLGVYFGGQEASIFSILIFVYTIMLLATLTVAKEVPLSHSVVPVDIATVSASSSSSSNLLSITSTQPKIINESGYESSSNSSEDGTELSKARTRNVKKRHKAFWKSFLYCRGFVCRLVSFLPDQGRCVGNLLGCVVWLGKKLVPAQLMQLFKIPTVLKLLAFADVCSWTAIMCFNIYYTDYVGQIVYGGSPNAPENSPEGKAYDEGVRVASWGLLLHCICSAGFSFFIERLTITYGYRTTFTMGMVSFVFSMLGMVSLRHIYIVNLMAASTGFAYATITTIPYMLVSKYHANKKVYFADLPPAMLSDSERGIGSDIAVLDWSYFLSQVVLTYTMGSIVHLTGTLISYMVTAGSMGVLAIYYIGRIVENEAQARRCISNEL